MMIDLRRAAMLVAFAPLLGACVAPSPERTSASAQLGGRVGPRVADAMLQAGDAVAALQVADGMLAADPHDTDARLRRGRALLALGRASEAAEDLGQAAQQRPRDVSIQAALAAARAAEGEPLLAEAAWRAVLAGPAPDAQAERQARIGLGISLDLQERHAEAQALYRDVLRDRPDDVAASANLGLSLALAGHPKEGLAYLQRPGFSSYGVRLRHDLAVALVLAGEDAQARAVLAQDMGEAAVASAIAGVRALAPG